MTDLQAEQVEKAYRKLASDQIADMFVSGVEFFRIDEIVALRIGLVDAVSTNWIVEVPPRIKNDWFAAMVALVGVARQVEILFKKERAALEKRFAKKHPDKVYLLGDNPGPVTVEDQRVVSDWYKEIFKFLRKKYAAKLRPIIDEATVGVAVKLSKVEKNSIEEAFVNLVNLVIGCYYKLPEKVKPMFLDWLEFDFEHLKKLVAARPPYRSDA